VAVRRASYHHGDLQRALIDATLRLAGERGAPGVTLREVARVAGVSQTAPYRHFADKTAMLAAASEEGFVMLREAMRDAAAPFAADPRRRVVELGIAYVQFAVTHVSHFRLMFGHGSPPKAVAAALQARAREAFQLMFVAVGECLARKILRPTDHRTTMLQIWAIGHGIATLIIERQTLHLGVTAAEAAAIARAAFDAQLAGLARTRPGHAKRRT
jgi:AcrR family transcriptional regulator